MKISVLINTYNRRDALSRTLEGVFAQSYPAAKIEILILDDAGSDGTGQIIDVFKARAMSIGFVGLRYHVNASNMGIAYGRAFLTSKASADCRALLYLDDDVIMQGDCLEKLSGLLRARAEAAVAGPRIVYASSPGKTAHCAGFVGGWTGRYSEVDSALSVDCDWLNSSCFLVRREAVPARRAWAEEFYTAHEEVDFCLHVKKSGFKVVYLPAALALHEIEFCAPAKRDRLYYLYRNKLLVLRRNFPLLRRFSACAVTILAGLPRYVMESLLFHRALNWREISLIFKGVFDGLAGQGGKIP